MEEGEFERACEEIETGLLLLDELNKKDVPEEVRREAQGLHALADAWNARAACERGDVKKAAELIEPALAVKCEPWVRARVLMVAGDIELSSLNYSKALERYLQCVDEMESYGGEGDGYQTDPRIGLAYVSLRKLDKAEKIFERLKDNPVTKVGKLYGRYGLALVQYKRGETQSASAAKEKLKSEVQKQTRSNLLIGLIDKLTAQLEPVVQKHHEDVPVVDPAYVTSIV